MASIKNSKKVRAGLYEIHLNNGGMYQIEFFCPSHWDNVDPDPQWRLYECEFVKLYFNDKPEWYTKGDHIAAFATKRESLEWIKNFG